MTRVVAQESDLGRLEAFSAAIQMTALEDFDKSAGPGLAGRTPRDLARQPVELQQPVAGPGWTRRATGKRPE